MARSLRSAFTVSYRGQMPVSDWQSFRRDALHDIGAMSKQVVASSAPSGYAGLKSAAGYRIVDWGGRPSEDGRIIDLRPRMGNRVHPLYYIAEAGRRTSLAGFNQRRAGKASGRKALYNARRGFGPYTWAKGYRGTRYLSKAIRGPILGKGGDLVARKLEDYWKHTKQVSG